MTYDEAAAVSGDQISGKFYETNIKTFDEFEWFTGIVTLPRSTFERTTKLTSIKLPNNLKVLGENNFYCPLTNGKLDEIVVPASVTQINNPFNRGIGLKRIYLLPTTPPSTSWKYADGVDSFPNGTVYIPVGTEAAYAPRLKCFTDYGWAVSATL